MPILYDLKIFLIITKHLEKQNSTSEIKNYAKNRNKYIRRIWFD
jgi:hypothetical protein